MQSKSINRLKGKCFVNHRVVSRFLGKRFHPKRRRLFSFYFSNITVRTDVLTFGVTGAVFKIVGEMRRLPAYFDNPVIGAYFHPHTTFPSPSASSVGRCCTYIKEILCDCIRGYLVIVFCFNFSFLSLRKLLSHPC